MIDDTLYSKVSVEQFNKELMESYKTDDTLYSKAIDSAMDGDRVNIKSWVINNRYELVYGIRPYYLMSILQDVLVPTFKGSSVYASDKVFFKIDELTPIIETLSLHGIRTVKNTETTEDDGAIKQYKVIFLTDLCSKTDEKP